MAFTDDEKTAIRRFCGYPMYGGLPVQAFGHRFYQQYGTLEFRMNNALASEETVIRSYLSTLATLETAVSDSSANLDTDAAAVWTHNKKEVRDRMELFTIWRKKLCNFFGVPPGPRFDDGELGFSLVV